MESILCRVFVSSVVQRHVCCIRLKYFTATEFFSGQQAVSVVDKSPAFRRQSLPPSSEERCEVSTDETKKLAKGGVKRSRVTSSLARLDQSTYETVDVCRPGKLHVKGHLKITTCFNPLYWLSEKTLWCGFLDSPRGPNREDSIILRDRAYLAVSLTVEAVCLSEKVCCSTSSSSVLWRITRVWSGGPLPAATSGRCKFHKTSAFELRLTQLGRLVTGKFTRIWGFYFSPTASEHWLRVSTQSYLLRGTPYFGNSKGACADRGLTEGPPRVIAVNWRSAGQRATWKDNPSRCNEYSLNYSANLTEVFHALPQL
jgi:hypothetical protein